MNPFFRATVRQLHGVLLFLLLIALLAAGCGGSSANLALEPVQKPVSPSQPEQPPVETALVQKAPAPAAPAQKRIQAPAVAPQPTPTPAERQTAADRVNAALSAGHKPPASGMAAECWTPLIQRLQNDPKASPEMTRYFCALPEYSPAPMGTKVKELFTNAFMRKPRVDDGKPKPPPSRIYRNVVTAATMQKCLDFMETHKTTLDAVEKKYPIPREVLVSLLFVETRLGTYVGKENAFWSLACMAAADSPERVRDGLGDIPITEKHDSWLQAKLTDKSNWAYNELRSLLVFCDTQKLDLHAIPGSVYGAIGICQFMPSNLLPYGDDGDGDGVINLFSVPDAIFSAAKYLTMHGWQEDMRVTGQRSVLKRYNNLTVYANTILALAESMRTGVVQTGPPDAPIKTATAQKGTKQAKKTSPS